MEDMEQRWCFTQVSKNGGKRMSLITFVASPQSSESFVFGSHNWDCSSSISGFLSTKWKTAKNRVQGSSSMRIWWMIIVSTFLWHHQKNFDSSFHSFLTYRFLKQPMFITNRKNSEIEVLSPPSITKECRVITRLLSLSSKKIAWNKQGKFHRNFFQHGDTTHENVRKICGEQNFFCVCNHLEMSLCCL